MLLSLLLLAVSVGPLGHDSVLERSGIAELGVPMVLSLRGPLSSDHTEPKTLFGGGKGSLAYDPGAPQPGGAALDTASRVSTACLLGSLLPGAGHVASDTYIYRGLAFTLAFLLTFSGGATFLSLEEEGLGGRYAVTGAWVLLLGAQVIYVWSLVDAITLASSPQARRR